MPSALDKIAVLAAFAVGLATIAGAWLFQLLGGLFPCELCLEQRVAYYWGLPLLALVLIVWNRLPLTVWYIALAAAAAIFAWGAYMGAYHAGVEYGFWPGPTACTGTGGGLSFEQLADIDAARIIPCDKVQWQLLGISLAGFNALISAGILALLLAAMWWQARRSRRA